MLAASAPILVAAGALLAVLPRLDPDGPRARLWGSAAIALLLVRYMAWRITLTLPDSDDVVETLAAWSFLLIEMASCAAGLILLHVLSRTIDRTAEVEEQLARPDRPMPLIDLFIPTYNEAREILERTIVGARAQTYPRLRVWVLDDKRRPWLRDLAAELGVGYCTRPDNAHAKAGNMNAGLKHVLALPEPPDAIAILDADFVPTPDFLSRASVLLHDPTVAVVQTPQHFFNPDPIQLNLGDTRLVPDEQRFFFDVLLSSKDAHGTAFSCGTSSIVRVSALREAGGFPTESVTEDLLLSIKMKALGYRTVYLNEPLSYGLAPEGLGEYLTQRGRWCLGTMQIVRTPWGPLTRRRMPLLMRLHTLDTVLFWTAGAAVRLACLLVPIIYWWFGVAVMRTDLDGLLGYLGPYWISCVVFLGWVSRGTNLPLLVEAMALLTAFEALRASAIGLFGARDQKFKVTAKGGSRDKVVVHWSLIRLYGAFAVATVGGIVWRVVAGPLPGTPPGIESMNLFWSFYNVAMLMIAICICVEQPRRRRQERFAADEPVALLLPDRAVEGRLADISISGAGLRVKLPAHVGVGADVWVRLDGMALLAARITRAGDDSTCSVAFDLNDRERLELTAKVYSGRYNAPVKRMSVARFARLLAVRAWG